ncbi:hypothetical protein VHEMI08760 [[Torrubiella] hemipterigena]|uniref:Arrestin C-terminal-like domain-containing protein n=1 Tax=[Torrubiella] hemipterigena TaxID=1531966 RepID=A0A0A1TEI0_9HYPO|nr:hypothetical protein VHEMI08760 [[Torrubiella] hemipterigena]
MASQAAFVAASAEHVLQPHSYLNTRHKSSPTTSIKEIQKPVASGSGVICSIVLAEPTVFLYGFDHERPARQESRPGSALLRGKLQLKITKNVKIKAVQLKLQGKARTEWPEGIPPLKQDLFEEEGLRTQVLTFFNAMNEGWESEYGNQCNHQLKERISPSASSINLNPRASVTGIPSPISARGGLTAKDLKRLSLQSNQSRSFGKGDTGVASATQAKGYKVFYPGTYEYTFELPIDHHQLETTKLPYGSVKWELHATIDRAGAFKPNLHGNKEVCIARLPDPMSLEMTEPISINRTWDDQLHYDIAISGKSFPIGAKIPIAFKLTPLAKVQLHKLKVYVTESTEYWTNDHRVTRKDPGRKILLLEKVAGKPLDSAWNSSSLRTVRGGELSADQRRDARYSAQLRRSAEASKRNSAADPLPQPSENLLGDIDLGLESMWGSTEIEANVQIPTCEMMARNKDLRLSPDCSWKNVNVYHWIKVVMRISRPDPEDPSGKKRRHFEISIDSPFTILSCRASRANTYLPAYCGSPSMSSTNQYACGCPDADSIPADPAPNNSSGETLVDSDEAGGEAHIHEHTVRPMHLIRVPSYNPPSWDEDTSPPPPMLVDETPQDPMPTPPPLYDHIVGTPSVDGLADYFTRLANYHGQDGDDSSDSDETPPRLLERSGRVNVAHPRTPGGRMPSRSFEINRGTFELQMGALPTRA